MAANQNAKCSRPPTPTRNLQPKAWYVPSSCSHTQHRQWAVEGKPCPCFGRPVKTGTSFHWFLTTQTHGVVTVGGDVSQTLTHFYLQAWVHASPKLPHSEIFKRMINLFKKNDIWESHNLSASFSSCSTNSQQVSYSLPILCLLFLLCEFSCFFQSLEHLMDPSIFVYNNNLWIAVIFASLSRAEPSLLKAMVVPEKKLNLAQYIYIYISYLAHT